MKPNETWLTSSDVHYLDQISQAVLECGKLDRAGVGDRHTRIGDLLWNNVRALDLDEDIAHLCGFARSVACEAMTPEAKNKYFPNSCWKPGPWDKFPPFFKRIDGNSTRSSDIRPVEKQKIGMVNTLASILRNDPTYSAGAQALLEYQDAYGLWGEEDYVDS